MAKQKSEVTVDQEIDAMMAQMEAEEVSADDDDELAELLAATEEAPAAVTEVPEVEVSVSDKDAEAVIEELELTEEINAEQEAQAEEEEEERAAQKTPGAPPAAKKPAAKTGTRGISHTPSEALKAIGGTDWKDLAVFDAAETALSAAALDDLISKRLMTLDSSAKKQKEKVINIFKFLAEKATLSVYTDIALGIIARTGSLSTKELRDAYLAKPYSTGTTNAQSSQLMNIIPMMRIALPKEGKLVANPDSTILSHYKSVNKIA